MGKKYRQGKWIQTEGRNTDRWGETVSLPSVCIPFHVCISPLCLYPSPLSVSQREGDTDRGGKIQTWGIQRGRETVQRGERYRQGGRYRGGGIQTRGVQRGKDTEGGYRQRGRIQTVRRDTAGERYRQREEIQRGRGERHRHGGRYRQGKGRQTEGERYRGGEILAEGETDSGGQTDRQTEAETGVER